MEFRPNSHQHEAGYFTADSFRMQERYTTNNNARIPICFCVDVSSSMERCSSARSSSRIELLSSVMRRLLTALKSDPILGERACVCIVTYNKYAITAQDFLDVADVNIARATSFSCLGQTRFSEGLNQAMREIDAYQQSILDSDNTTATPILIFMTDGEPVGEFGDHLNNAIRSIQKRTAGKQLHMLPLGISKEAQMNLLVDMVSCMEDGRAYRMIEPEDFESVFSKIRELIDDNMDPTEQGHVVNAMASENEATQDTGSGQDMFLMMVEEFARSF